MNLRPLAVVLALTLPLAACGNKGPLVRPGAVPPPTQSPVPDMPLPAPPPAESTAPPADTTVPTPPPADAGHG